MEGKIKKSDLQGKKKKKDDRTSVAISYDILLVLKILPVFLQEAENPDYCTSSLTSLNLLPELVQS